MSDAMLQKLAEITEQQGFLDVRLRNEQDFDAFIYEQIRMDEECLSPLQQKPGCFRYEISGLTSLAYFLKHYRFEQEEAYLFLIALFEHVLKANRNKPVLFDVQHVFLHPNGTYFRFLALPLNVEHWYLQKEECQTFIRYISEHFQTSQAYEIIGFLVRILQAEEFSLTAVLQGLLVLKQTHPIKRTFWEKLRHRVQEEQFAARVRVLEEREVASSVSKPLVIEEEKVEYAPTSLLYRPVSTAFFQYGEQRLPLDRETVCIGRDETCEICLTSAKVSRRHVQLRQANERWYVKDLHSRNGSWLNAHPLKREMRLREGMELRIGDQRLVFHEGEETV